MDLVSNFQTPIDCSYMKHIAPTDLYILHRELRFLYKMGEEQTAWRWWDSFGVCLATGGSLAIAAQNSVRVIKLTQGAGKISLH